MALEDISLNPDGCRLANFSNLVAFLLCRRLFDISEYRDLHRIGISRRRGLGRCMGPMGNETPPEI